MSHARAFRRVCAFLGLGFVCLSGVKPELAVAKPRARAAAELPRAIVFPPRTPMSGTAPIMIALHGMCGGPEMCGAFANAATARGFLVCPRAPVGCAGGGTSWDPALAAEAVEGAIADVMRDYPGRVDPSRRTLVGFSQGAFVAMRLAHDAPMRWSHLVLLAAKVDPSASALSRASGMRVLFGAGDLDASQHHMRDRARALGRAGIETRFVTLGRVGHRFAVDMDSWMTEAFSWVNG